VEYQYIVVDGVISSVASQKSLTPEGKVVYEVVRLIDGKPLFWQEHYHRLIESCNIAKIDFSLSSTTLTKAVQELVTANHAQLINFKIEVFEASAILHHRIFLISSHYPDISLYKSGVSLGLMQAERKNPQAKVINAPVRDKANQLIAEDDYFEVLLVNAKGEITEGSRSNVFFIKGSTLITPPVADVLPGITRGQVIKIALHFGFTVEETTVTVSELPTFDLAFITGTSPMLLPAKRVESIAYNPINALFMLLLEGYKQRVAQDLNAFDY